MFLWAMVWLFLIPGSPVLHSRNVSVVTEFAVPLDEVCGEQFWEEN